MADSNVKIRLALEGASAVTAGLQSIGTAALRIGTLIAGAAGLGALGAAALNTARLGGELSDLAARTGISARALVVLRQAFTDAGVGADAVGSSVNKMQRTIVEAATAGGAASDALNDIGLSARDLVGLAPEDQFQRVAAAISAIQDPAQRSAAAMAIFGKSGGELLPLFADGGAIENAERVLGKMPEVLGRNVPILDSISDAFDRLPNKATQLFAGILDQIAPSVQAILEGLESIDLTRAGQRIGAYLNVAAEEIREGRLGEFVGLTIEAGFETGFAAVREMIDKLMETETAKAVGNFSVTLVAGIGKAFIDLQSFFKGFWHAIAVYAGMVLATAFTAAVNALAAGLEAAINGALKMLPAGLGGGGSLKLGRMDSPGEADFGKAFIVGQAIAQNEATFLKGTVQLLVDKYRELFDIKAATTEEDGKQLTAAQRLAALIDAQLKKREDRARANEFQGPPAPAKDTPADRVANVRVELQRLELGLQQRLGEIAAERSRVESSWLLTTNQKREERKRLLLDEKKALEDQVLALARLRDGANENDRLTIDKKLAGLQGRAAGIDGEVVGLGPDPRSFGEQFGAMLVDLQSQFLTAAQFMAKAFADAFGAATASISNGIQGLIYGTMTWGQALLNIGQSIVQSLVRSFSDMVAQWIMSHVIMRGVSTAWAAFQATLRAKDVVQANATEAAKMPALAANATLASVASYGVAAIIGVAAIAGILASLGAFREGGYTGDGDPNQVAGVVHRGEYVIPADAVDRVGIGALEAIANGASPAAVQTSAGAPAPITMNVGVFDDPRRLSDWARSSEGRTVLMDIYRQHAHEFDRA